MSSQNSEPNVRNSYMDQVMAQQQQVEVDLKAKRVMLPSARAAQATLAEAAEDTGIRRRRVAAHGAEQRNLGNAVDVRITGFWRWKTVVVPPNAYVVHTRRGAPEPLHLGLGISFRFDPMTDSFLVVPGTMQTILINAYCICRELQGLLVQGYVQWIIADFATAYKKLDFSDVEDPMRVVNVQLREQAEAAIKDKVATMGIDDVLSDKQPIIEELTARLRAVAEGEGTDKGLGLRIVTVQIKEAVVSSTRVWENLQKPFRAERARVARLAELAADSAIQAREAEHTKERETRELEVEAEMARLRAAQEAETFDREQNEAMRRKQREAEALARTAEMERARIETEAELASRRAAAELAQKEAIERGELALQEARHESRNKQARAEVELLAARQKVHNDLTSGNLEARLIESLPLIAEKLPKPKELRAVTISGANGHGELGALIAELGALLEAFRAGRPGAGGNGKAEP